MVKWLVSKFQGCKVNSTIPIKAITWGSIELLNFLLESDNSSVDANTQTAEVGLHVDWDRDLLIDAVSSRHCHVMWWVLEHLPHIQHDKNRAMRIAVINGDIPLAEWFLSNGATWPRNRQGCQVAHTVACQGRLDILRWLVKQGQGDGLIGFVVMAADTGELDVVRWVIDRDVQTNGKLLTDLGGEVSLSIHAAAVNGHLEVAKYLRAWAEKPRDSFQRAVEAAEYRRSIKALSIQLPYTKKDRIVSGKTMSKAAKKGYLDVIKWLCSEYGDDPGVDLFDYDEGCLWSSPVMDAAARNGNLEIVKYLHSLQVTMDSNGRKRTSPKCAKQAMNFAAERSLRSCKVAALQSRGRLHQYSYGCCCNTWTSRNCPVVAGTPFGRVHDGSNGRCSTKWSLECSKMASREYRRRVHNSSI